jgi:tetratricopeptide (TPR) repeat protein
MEGLSGMTTPPYSTLSTISPLYLIIKGNMRNPWRGTGRSSPAMKRLAKDHPSTLNTINNLAIVFHTQVEYEKALELYTQALDGREKTLGKHHPDTLGTINNMASVFYNQEQYEKGEWYRRALAGYEKDLGKDHPSTLDTAENIAILFGSQGQYEKSLE